MATKRKFFRTMFNEFTIVGQIGQGDVGAVYEVQDLNEQPRAVKMLDPSKASRDRLRRSQHDIQLCMQDRSRNVIRILDYGTFLDGSSFYVMPLYPRSLRSQMRMGIAPADVLPLFAQILDGVEAAHFFKVSHLDLKPENILLDPSTKSLVISDFGMSKFLEEDLHSPGTNFPYAAPEQRMSGEDVGPSTDIFSCGLILNELFTHTVPSRSGFTRIAEVAPEFAYFDELVEAMIAPRPVARLQTIFKVKGELIARGNHFILQQRLDAAKREVVPETEIIDPILADPIRPIDKIDFRDGSLTLKLNQLPSEAWLRCFRNMKSFAWNTNFSPANVTFSDQQATLRTPEYDAAEAVRLFRTYCEKTNEDYKEMVCREHRKRIESARAALAALVRDQETRMALFKKIEL
jgi:serine/threonine protein kinase